MGFDADLLVPAGTHDLSKAGGIVPVGLVRHVIAGGATRLPSGSSPD
jgi:hypothetical protein